jgi:urea transport system ATP-binding protein
MTENVIFAAKGLTVSFDGFKAVDDLSLFVQENELRVVIGPNGAGKTTLLDMICGKTKPNKGTIQFQGLELTRMEDYQITRVGVGRKFQTPSTYEDLKVFQNLEISDPNIRTVAGCILFKRSDQLVERIHEIAEMVYLEDALDKKAGTLSHGQKQWLEIGMLLMQDPKLLLLDEPVAGMSLRERELTAELLKKISKGRSMIVIEHDMDFVKSIAHNVTVLHQGKILAEGTMEEIQSNEKVINVYLGH